MEPEYLGNNSTNAPRKVKFAPKGPPRRMKKPLVPKVEKTEESESDISQAQELLRRFNEATIKTKPKFNKKDTPAQVAFGFGGTSASSRSYPGSSCQDSSSKVDGAAAPGRRDEKEYKEPWDYYTYYPVSLPLRRPYSGNPEVLDEEEFGMNSESMTYSESFSDLGMELGLMEEKLEASMFILHLPSTFPFIKQLAATNGQEKNNPKPSKASETSENAHSLDKIPAGFKGKMLVYRSGAVKLKLGDTLYNVCPGEPQTFAEEVVTINTHEKHCCVVGEVNNHVIITPDTQSLYS